MDMISIVANEQCQQRIQAVLNELGFTDRRNFVEDATRYGLNQGFVLDVTTMNLSEMMVHGQRTSLLIGRCKCADSGELDEPLKALQCAFKLCESQRNEVKEDTSCRRFQKSPS